MPSGDILEAGTPAGTHQFGYVHGSLTVPWQTTALLGIEKHRNTDTYNILIGELPGSPGNITVYYT